MALLGFGCLAIAGIFGLIALRISQHAQKPDYPNAASDFKFAVKAMVAFLVTGLGLLFLSAILAALDVFADPFEQIDNAFSRD